MLRGFILAAAYITITFTSSATTVGHIEHSAGATVILHDSKVMPATAGTGFELNDIIRTDSGALLQLVLSDGSSLLIEEKSELRVAVYDPELQQVVIELLHGWLRADVAAVNKPTGRFAIRTPTASVYAIGTTVEVETSSVSGTITAQELENLPTSDGRTMSALETAFAVGNNIKPTSETSSVQPPRDLRGIPSGSLTSSFLGSYPGVDTTRITQLNDFSLVSNVNPAVVGSDYLLPGQSTHIDRNRPPLGYGSDLGGQPVKDHLWFWGSYGNQEIHNAFLNTSAVLRDFNNQGQVCTPGVVINGATVAGTANYKAKILGKGTSTGHALELTITDLGSCPIYYFVPAGTILNPKGFTERVITGLLFGGPVPKLKDFQKMITFGTFLRVVAPSVLGAGPAAPPSGEVAIPFRSYCVELHKLAPHPKTEYKFGDDGDQEKLGINKPVLQRVLKLWMSRQLPTDKGHNLDAILQWSLWARIEKMNEKEFMDEFLKLVHKNYEVQKKKWDKDAEKQVLSSGQELWKLVQVVLQ